MTQFQPLCPGFGFEAHDVDISVPLSAEAFAELERAFYAGQVLVLRDQSLTPAQFVALRAPPRPAAAARDRPVPPSGRPQHPDPVQREEGRQAHRPAGCGLVLPYRLLVPAGAGAGDDALFDRRAEDRRRHAVRQPAGRVRRPAGGDEAADRAALRHPSLRQSPRHRRAESHRGVAAHRRAEGEDAAHHAQDRAAASGDGQEVAVRGQRQLVRHRRHARRRGASTCWTSSPRTRRSRSIGTASSTASATS